MTTVFICISDYIFSHGHAPRGRGGWLFVNTELASHPEYYKYAQNFNGTYTECKKQAIAWAKSNNITSLTVCS